MYPGVSGAQPASTADGSVVRVDQICLPSTGGQGDPRLQQAWVLSSATTPTGRVHSGTETRMPGRMGQQAPGVLRSRPWEAKVKFPRTSRGGCFACQSLTPAVQTVFAACILASPSPFILHSLLWLHPSLRPFIASSPSPSLLWLPRPHASDYRGSV